MHIPSAMLAAAPAKSKPPNASMMFTRRYLMCVSTLPVQNPSEAYTSNYASSIERIYPDQLRTLNRTKAQETEPHNK